MPQSFTNELETVSSSLYAAVFDDSGWQAATAAVRTALRSDHACLAFIDHKAGKDTVLHGECEPQYERLFFELININPFIPNMNRLQPGRVLVDEQMAERAAFERSEFFNLWMRPQAQHSGMAMKVMSRDGIGGYVMTNRGGRSDKYGSSDIKRLNAISNTVTHALALHGQFSARLLEQNGRLLDGRGIGWMAVDPAGRIMWSNARAEELLERPELALKSRQGKLVLSQPRQMRQLQAAIRAASEGHGIPQIGSDMMATRLETGHAVALSIIPANNLFIQGLPTLRGAYVAVMDLSDRLPPGFEDRIRAMFDLTPMEAALAATLSSGQTLAEAALSRNISLTTVRSQLAQLFRKTGTSRQSQLVALLLAVLPFPQ